VPTFCEEFLLFVLLILLILDSITLFAVVRNIGDLVGVQGRIGWLSGHFAELLTEGPLEVVGEVVLGAEKYDTTLRDWLS
jgi:hypothetical protein